MNLLTEIILPAASIFLLVLVVAFLQEARLPIFP